MQNYILYFIPFVFGLVVGSFLNCVIYRLENKKSFLRGRSFCPHCKHYLSWQDLIPVLSFFILGGKCRYCKKPISWQYPSVEIATGILFVLIFQFLKLDFYLDFKVWALNFLYFSFIFCLLVIIFVFDLRHYIIPDRAVFAASIAAFIYQLFKIFNFNVFNLFEIWKFKIENFQPLIPIIMSAAGASFFFLIIVLISRGNWMGLGDVKLAFFMGLFLGFPDILVALFLAFLIGAIIGLGLIYFKKKKLKSEIPFGPFLVFSTTLSLFFGEKIINWYLTLFL